MEGSIFRKKASSSQKPRVDRFVPPRSSIEGVRQRWSLVKTWDVGADQNNWHSKYVHQRKFATHMEGAFGLSHPGTARDRGLAEDEVDSIQPWPCRPRKRSYLTSADSVLDLPTYRFALFPELLDWNSDDVLVAALGHKYYKWSWSRQGLVDSGYTQNPVYCCKFDPRGELLALGTAYCQVEVHHHGMTKRLAVSSCACARLVDDQCLITALDWSPTGNSFVTGCSHGMVCCFDRATSLVTRHRRACAGCVLRARISPDARYVAVSQVAAQFVLVMTWPQLVPYFSLEPNGWTVMTLNWHPWRSALLGVGAMSQTDHARVALWDVPPIREVHEAVVSPGRYHVDSMLFSPRSGELVLSLWNSERDAATDLAKGSRIVVLSSPDSIVDQWGEGRYYLDRVRTMVFSPDGTKLATATTEEDLIIWNFLPEDKKQKGYFKRRFCDLPVHFDETSFGISKR
ncbi:hypothetical protein JYU34_013046 [Plutella xylostella]|uniref:Cortex n=1 Tax=Plutella xylostella TaxID=51655 RepID=A0ABQ7QCU4_PLUXY|nr:hypothetical protein JYU34_013046 [Plutella xylostella]